jgi:hypothetical protein
MSKNSISGPARHLQIGRNTGPGETSLLARGVGALLHDYDAAQPAAAPGRVGNKKTHTRKPTKKPKKTDLKKTTKNVFFGFFRFFFKFLIFYENKTNFSL